MDNAARTLRYLAVHAYQHLIRRPSHWGLRPRIHPERARSILAAGPEWRDRFIASVPDEFYTWIRSTTGIAGGVARYWQTWRLLRAKRIKQWTFTFYRRDEQRVAQVKRCSRKSGER